MFCLFYDVKHWSSHLHYSHSPESVAIQLVSSGVVEKDGFWCKLYKAHIMIIIYLLNSCYLPLM